MTALLWDQVGDRTYQTGVDRGVLYLPGENAVAWNGLTSIEEKVNRDVNSYYLDGVKYLEHQLPGDFSASLKAFTYPDEFDLVNGVAAEGNGLFIHDQKPISFGLSYRTLIGDDISGTDRGYKIHLLYNILAVPDNSSYETLDAQAAPITFGWSLSGTPVATPGYRPTSHISLDSTKMDSDLLAIFETKLYGSAGTIPTLPSFQELLALIQEWGSIVVTVDNGDGTWSVSGHESDVRMTDDTTFEITRANATYSDPDTYEISSTEV